MLSCLLGTLLTSVSAISDDTEVFFSSAHGGTLSKSNILFVLDNSGSMGYGYDDTWRWGPDYSTPQNYPAVPNRMSDLQATMNTLLQTIKNVNIGMMTFTYDCLRTGPDGCLERENYARLIHPVVDIDEGSNRATLQNSVSEMLPRTNTPITAALYEAAMAMTGGKKGKLPGSYTSPILSECQQHHIVILSDGIANSDVPQHDIQTLIGKSCGPGTAKGEYCGLQLAQWLAETDHIPGGESPKKNPINVHTIGFTLNNTFLEELAEAGGGGAKRADNGSELAEVFNEILTEVKDVDTTFVAPVTSTDRLNRLGNSDDLYYGMFNPSLKPKWDGNLKKYKLAVDNTGEIIIKDANDNYATDDDTGYFSDSSRSIWSKSTDGAFVTKGGAASKIIHAGRNMYTYLGNPLTPDTNPRPVNLKPTGASVATIVDVRNRGITNALLGVTNNAERTSVINWARGSDTEGLYDDPSDPTDSRKHIGDILHSTPISVNYEASQGGSLIFFGTNEGFIHAVNSNDGTEAYSFIPQELLRNLNLFREDSRDTPHPYGLDGSITFKHIDDADADFSTKDGDGIVNNNETAAIYFGMRRGGRDYFAIDVSSRTQPKLMWQIKGGTGDFVSLGQTWSKPNTARVRYKGNVRDVLIFAGGYDENQDPTNEANLTSRQSVDTMGNAIYIVDSKTGKLLWKADRGSHRDMNYSIPSDIRILDIDGDGLSDRLYVGDMGGQIWRFDIDSAHSSGDNASELVRGGVMAKLGGRDNGDNTISGARRFYSKPDVALISSKGQHFMSVSIGSGWRAHPRNRDIDDRFYMIRDNRPLEKIMDSSQFGAVNTQTAGSTTATWVPLTESDLKDITNTLDNSGRPDQEGWMLRFDDAAGEKSLSGSVTVNNQIVFASYTSEVHRDDCLPASDSTTVYAVDVLTGNPVLPLAGGGTLSVRDRGQTKFTNGIPPEPTVVIKQAEDGSYSTGTLLGTSPVLQNLDFGELTKRTYWHDRRRGSSKPSEVTEVTCSMVKSAMC